MRRSILVVAPCLPLPADFGGAVRIYHLVQELAKNHDVSVVAPARREEMQYVPQLGEICDVTAVPVTMSMRHRPLRSKRISQARSIASRHSFLERSTWNAQLQGIIARLFLTRQIDLVQYEFTQMALHELPRPCPTVIDAHNIEYELLSRVAIRSPSPVASALKMTEARKVKRLEQRLWSKATTTIATSERDAAVIAPHSGSTPLVVPNGVDVAAFAPNETNIRRARHVVFTGVLRHEPNVDGIRWYLQHVHPLVLAALPEATLSIVGADPPEFVTRFASPSIRVTGHVPDVRPFLHEGSAAIVPLFSGGGTRLKIVEAFAAGIPVVSTTIGAEGIEARDNLELMIANDAETFARKLVTLLTNEELAQQIASAARKEAASRYDWSVISESLLAAHEQALSASR